MDFSYAGIGSRSTPPDVLASMTPIATHLAKQGWTLRSGGADGADMAFEKGCDVVHGDKRIFLPWRGFNKNLSPLYTPHNEAFKMAARIHPAWHKLTRGGKALHARNCHQILGEALNDPVSLVVCWTPGGKATGGTATAIHLAEQYRIRIINLATQIFPLEQFTKENNNGTN